MCHFITLIIPNRELLDKVSISLESHHRKMAIIGNAHLSVALRAGEIDVHPESKMGCDCGTALGSLRSRAEVRRPQRSEVEGLRRKGWGTAKIERWFEQRKAIENREARIDSAKRDASTGTDPDGWCSIMKSLLSDVPLSHVGLLLHWYSGSLDGEKIQVAGRTTLSLDGGLAESLYQMEEDRIYEIRLSRA